MAVAVQQETTSTEPEQNNLRLLSVSALYAAFFVDRTEDFALSVLWPQIHRSLGVSIGQLGPVLGLGQLVGTLMLPLWGYAVDRYSRKKLLVWFTGIWGLWTCAMGLVDSLPQLLLVRALSALGLSVFVPAAFSLVGDLFDNQNRGRTIGILRTAPLIGVLAILIGLPILAAQNAEAWRWGFVAIGLASFISGLLMLFIQEPARGTAEPELHDVITDKTAHRYSFHWRDLRTLARIRSWWWLGLKEVLEAISILVFFRWFFPWFDELGLGERAFILFVVMLGGNVVGFILFGWLGDLLDITSPRYGRVGIVLISLIVQLITLPLFFTVGSDDLALLSVFGFLFSLGFGASAENIRWPLTQAILPPELRGSGQAFITMAAGLSGAVILAASGLVADQIGIASMLLLFTPLPILVSIVAWIPMFRTYLPDREALHQRLAQRRAELLDLPEQNDSRQPVEA